MPLDSEPLHQQPISPTFTRMDSHHYSSTQSGYTISDRQCGTGTSLKMKWCQAQMHYIGIGKDHWVLDVWSQADKNTLNPKLLTEYGGLKDGGIVWDSDTNIKEVMLRVAGLLKGCGCKTGCQTQRCGCKGKNKKCGVKAVNALIVQTLMIPLKLQVEKIMNS